MIMERSRLEAVWFSMNIFGKLPSRLMQFVEATIPRPLIALLLPTR
nr:MAG TPA: hypothetical protein [Caudoviricetes sp.]